MHLRRLAGRRAWHLELPADMHKDWMKLYDASNPQRCERHAARSANLYITAVIRRVRGLTCNLKRGLIFCTMVDNGDWTQGHSYFPD